MPTGRVTVVPIARSGLGAQREARARGKLEAIVDLLSLRAEARGLDIAAGKGELFLRILERYQCGGDAIEPSGAVVEGSSVEHAAT